MDGDWVEVNRIQFPPAMHNGMPNPSPVASMIFDPVQELLWVGNGFGRVQSYYGQALRIYTSFKPYPTGPVHQILVNEKGVIAIGSNWIHMARRNGPPLWHLEREDLKELRCMTFTSNAATKILVAGWQDIMFIVDVNKGEIVKEIATSEHYTHMKRSRYICAATTKGAVNLLDASSFEVIKTWNAHSAMINNMDAQHDYIVTCGYSLRYGQSYALDSFLNVFDMKKMKSIKPIAFPAKAAFVRLHPRMLTTAIVVSQQGQMHVVDLDNQDYPTTANMRQANVVSYLSMFDIAPSGEAIALADADSLIHLWGSPQRIRFLDFPIATEFANPPEPRQGEWGPNTPFNTIGMPYYRDELLSSWPANLVSDVGAPPVRLDARLLNTLTVADFGLYGRNTRALHRNQVENTRRVETASTSGIQAPKFLSEKARDSAKAAAAFETETNDITALQNPGESSTSLVPNFYRSVEIKYSKFGVEDFDFGFYNATRYSGLETHIANSYANSLLQVLHFTPLVRNLALHHAASACIDESCMLCEMGFLSDMLQKAEGWACQATNMLKTLSRQPNASALGLLEENPSGSTFPAMLQSLTRCLLDQFVKDFAKTTVRATTLSVSQVLTTEATSHIRCTRCANEYTRPGTTNVNDLVYPTPKHNARNQKPQRITFSQVVKASIERETSSKGWCSQCKKYEVLATRKTIQSIPSVLVLNTGLRDMLSRDSDQILQLWCTPGWLPDEIGIIVDQGQFFCYEGEDLKLHLQRGIHNVKVYSLVGLAANIADGDAHRPHLVALVDVAYCEADAPGESQWHLFNDFLVMPLTKADALTFGTWKVPCVLCFQLKEANSNNKVNSEWKNELDTSILYEEPTLRPSGRQVAARVLDAKIERPTETTIVALDTEFVCIRQPEVEVHSDGTQKTIRPRLNALGRVSVVRGWGEHEGDAFIDDYVVIHDPIVDYLTSYSGITQADLDPKQTKHNLVTFKVAYKKLWVLLNLGCRFLGHGLKSDFRVINIHIPKSQVIDTQELFYFSARLRKLSLSFLAHVLLNENIQQETHDSIEDARTALKLYRKYLEFKDAGILERMLQEIYNKGQKMGFKPPRGQKSDDARAGTPPPAADAANIGADPSTPSRSMGMGGAAMAGGSLASGSTSALQFGNVRWTPGKADHDHQ